MSISTHYLVYFILFCRTFQQSLNTYPFTHFNNPNIIIAGVDSDCFDARYITSKSNGLSSLSSDPCILSHVLDIQISAATPY